MALGPESLVVARSEPIVLFGELFHPFSRHKKMGKEALQGKFSLSAPECENRISDGGVIVYPSKDCWLLTVFLEPRPRSQELTDPIKCLLVTGQYPDVNFDFYAEGCQEGGRIFFDLWRNPQAPLMKPRPIRVEEPTVSDIKALYLCFVPSRGYSHPPLPWKAA